MEKDYMRGFKNFLMRGDVIVVAVGLVIALAFSALIVAFTTNIINPILQSFRPGAGRSYSATRRRSRRARRACPPTCRPPRPSASTAAPTSRSPPEKDGTG